ncbi:MAG TPA: YncE family protein, partial [Usitatibacter sp.]|nr:YncE family protein [Usitatibacter sp.]
MKKLAHVLAFVCFGLCAAQWLHAAPFAYVPLANGLGIVDLAIGMVVRTIPDAASDATIDTPGNRAYVVHPGRLAVIDVAAQAEIASVPLATHGLYVTLRPSHPEAWVVTEPCPEGSVGPGRCKPGLETIVRIVATDANAEVADVRLPKSANLVFSRDGNRVYAASFDKLHVIDLRNGLSSGTTVFVGNNSFSHIAVDPSERFVYVSEDGQGNTGNTVAVVDMQVRAVVARITVGKVPADMVLNASGTRLYVINTESGSVSVIDTAARAVIATVRLGGQPAALDLTPAEDRLAVMMVNTDSLTLVDTASLQPMATLAVGPHPIATGHFIGGRSAPVLPDTLTGLWWNPAEPGWGVHVAHRGTRIHAAWFTYGAGGTPKWYVSSDCTLNTPSPPPVFSTEVTCTGRLYETTGPRFFSDPYNPGAVNVNDVGLFQMGFGNRDTGAMSVVTGSTVKTMPLKRQVFSGEGPVTAIDYTDLWWNPAESGWGVGITQRSGA